VNGAMAGYDPPASVTIGIVDLEPEEPLSSLLRRADPDLYRQRHQT
jgi:PleD family two-component response regulator